MVIGSGFLMFLPTEAEPGPFFVVSRARDRSGISFGRLCLAKLIGADSPVPPLGGMRPNSQTSWCLKTGFPPLRKACDVLKREPRAIVQHYGAGKEAAYLAALEGMKKHDLSIRALLVGLKGHFQPVVVAGETPGGEPVRGRDVKGNLIQLVEFAVQEKRVFRARSGVRGAVAQVETKLPPAADAAGRRPQAGVGAGSDSPAPVQDAPGFVLHKGQLRAAELHDPLGDVPGGRAGMPEGVFLPRPGGTGQDGLRSRKGDERQLPPQAPVMLEPGYVHLDDPAAPLHGGKIDDKLFPLNPGRTGVAVRGQIKNPHGEGDRKRLGGSFHVR